MPRSLRAALAAALLAAGCAGQGAAGLAPAGTPTVPATPTPVPTHEELVRVCLYDSMAAYPTWPQPTVNVLDGLTSCKGLPQADKTRLRDLVRAFVTEYQRRSG